MAAAGIPKVGDTDSIGQAQYNFPAGFVRVTDEPRQLFYDPFDGAVVDVTNRWTAAFGLGNAVTPSQTLGALTVNAGSTSTGWATLTSQASFVPTIPAWFGNSHAISFTDGASFVSTGYRFWGVATNPGVPSVAAPITDGVGFEISSGKMYAVVYAAGTRTAVQDLSAATGNSTAPTDTALHRYICYVRTDRTYWYIDALTTPVATSSFQAPNVQTLPMKYLAVSGGSATTLVSNGAVAWDTGKNNTQISDGTYAWRKVTVNAQGAMRASEQGSTALATGQVTPTTTAGTLIAARATRKRIVFVNNGSTDAYIGPATVTTANGMLLPVGASVTLYTTALVQAIIASGTMTGAVHYAEEHDG